VLITRYCTSFRNKIPLPAAQGLTAEVATGGRPGIVNGTAPLPDTTAIRLLFAQVPAWGIGKEIAACFEKPPLAEVMQLVGLALPHGDKREPTAALATAAAGAS